MVFKCKNCGGNVVYSPERHTMFCPFCDSEKSEERHDYAAGELTICPNCGGEIPVEEHTSATQCPYCDNYLILNERVENEYEPRLIIPFQLGKEKCKEAIRNQFKKCLFAPTDFLSEVRLNHVQGIYVPHWFYDYDTTCSFQGEGTKVKSWTTGNMHYTETSFYAIHRNMDVKFRKLPADASLQMPDEVMDLMEPYQYNQMENFKPEYMSGFYGEKYNMSADIIEGRVKEKMRKDVEQMVKESYAGYSSVKTISQDVSVQHREVNYGLLPVWKYIYKYKERLYFFYVNGQTGKVVGTAPISQAKVWTYAGTLWAVLTLILLLLNGIFQSL